VLGEVLLRARLICEFVVESEREDILADKMIRIKWASESGVTWFFPSEVGNFTNRRAQFSGFQIPALEFEGGLVRLDICS